MKKLTLLFAVLAALSLRAADTAWVRDTYWSGDFKLVQGAQLAPVCVAPEDFECVRLAADLFASDVERVTGRKPAVVTEATPRGGSAVVIGTLGQSSLIDRLVAAGKLDAGQIKGQWESFLITVVDGSLVIAGSDRRGTAYGVFELSRAIGVSPWYWWADVPPAHRDNLFVAAATRKFGPPSVQYRGIFINDEDWALQPWAAKTFEPEVGNIGPKTYAKICELLLRLQANTLWPAMHESSMPFNALPENKLVADRYGIVMGASHCEPLLRNNVGEWPRDNQAAYNFLTNPAGVTKYWEERLRTNGQYENLYTIGMRGIHDGPMQGPRGDAQIVATLEKIFGVQRDLLAKYVNPDPAKVPQIFCPYKELLAYFLQDLKIPPDVTVVFPDDNFGYIRYYPTPAQIAARPGGFGVYYHISYLGHPLSYVWLNTTPPALIWEEMSKAYDHGMQKFWMLNVGDLKPGEIGIDFFMQMAWDVKRWNLTTLPDYLNQFATAQFGSAHAREIAEILADYYRLGYQRKPEYTQWNALGEPPRPSEFSYADGANEGVERLQLYQRLASRAKELEAAMPQREQDAFYELIEYPVLGAAAANQRFIAKEMATLAVRQHRANVGEWIDEFDAGTAELVAASDRYNQDLAGGKWKGMMEDDPLLASRPYRNAILRLPPEVKQFAPIPGRQVPAAAGDRALTLASPAPPGERSGRWIESDGVVSILAEHYSGKTDKSGAAWRVIPGLGRTGDAVAVFPTTAPAVELARAASAAPVLQYDFYLSRAGNATVHYNLIPTQPFEYGAGLRFAVAMDNDAPRLVTITAGTGEAVGSSGAWEDNVLANTTTAMSRHTFATAGAHTLRIYLVDPGVVLEKIVIDLGGLRPSYLGPPETLAAAK
jgi:glycosyl hydrolase family 115 (putative glucuronidase)/glycosyl hydrolase family 115